MTSSSNSDSFATMMESLGSEGDCGPPVSIRTDGNIVGQPDVSGENSSIGGSGLVLDPRQGDSAIQREP